MPDDCSHKSIVSRYCLFHPLPSKEKVIELEDSEGTVTFICDKCIKEALALLEGGE